MYNEKLKCLPREFAREVIFYRLYQLDCFRLTNANNQVSKQLTQPRLLSHRAKYTTIFGSLLEITLVFQVFCYFHSFLKVLRLLYCTEKLTKKARFWLFPFYTVLGHKNIYVEYKSTQDSDLIATLLRSSKTKAEKCSFIPDMVFHFKQIYATQKQKGLKADIRLFDIYIYTRKNINKILCLKVPIGHLSSAQAYQFSVFVCVLVLFILGKDCKARSQQSSI
uniref:Uncharacterized protein n=1 Tax=Glossina austeni TaxID=7395 RepID=A0A1A9UE29_GLOAU